jgi:hypothetical protein
MAALIALLMLFIYCAKSYSDVWEETPHEEPKNTMIEYPSKLDTMDVTVRQPKWLDAPKIRCLTIIPPTLIIHSERDCPGWWYRFTRKAILGIEYKELTEEEK